MKNEQKPQVSIIVPVYNGSSTISKCIEGCLSQKYLGDIEIIIVDDGSTDKSAEIIKSYPVNYLYEANQGPAVARNHGWRQATGKIICFTDADCIPDPNWVNSLVEQFTTTNIAGVGGTYGIANPDSLLAQCIHEEIIARHSLMSKHVNYLGSFNVAYRRTVLNQVGGFDESYRNASGEDNDLSYRIHKAGFDLLLEHSAVVLHHHPSSLLPYLRAQLKHGIWRVKLYQNHKDMMTGDGYSSPIDHLQPPLALMSMCAIPFLWIEIIFKLFLLALIIQFFLQIPLSIKIVAKKKQVKYLFFTIVTFLRAFARGIGLCYGVVVFGFRIISNKVARRPI